MHVYQNILRGFLFMIVLLNGFWVIQSLIAEKVNLDSGSLWVAKRKKELYHLQAK